MSNNLGIHFNGNLTQKNFKIKKIIKQLLPHKLKAIIWLIRRIKYALPLINSGKEEFKQNKSDVLFIDYLLI